MDECMKERWIFLEIQLFNIHVYIYKIGMAMASGSDPFGCGCQETRFTNSSPKPD